VLNVHQIATKIRGSNYGSLRGQMLRAAMSIPTNIVEGTGTRGAKEFARFLRIALASSSELEYHLVLARDFKLITPREFTFIYLQVVEVRKMLYGLTNSISIPEAKSSPATPDGK
jgi:four helix bundle protein